MAFDPKSILAAFGSSTVKEAKADGVSVNNFRHERSDNDLRIVVHHSGEKFTFPLRRFVLWAASNVGRKPADYSPIMSVKAGAKADDYAVLANAAVAAVISPSMIPAIAEAAVAALETVNKAGDSLTEAIRKAVK